MNKDELHAQFDSLVCGSTDRRSSLRIIGHALIELGLMTSMECGWEHCSQDTREFQPYDPKQKGQPRHPRVPSVDHVVSVSDGGSDLPGNIQIIHLACNAFKGQIDSRKNSKVVKAHSDGMKRMWSDPAKRAARIESVKQSQQRPDVKDKKSNAMKQAWDTVTPEERTARAKKAWETRRRNRRKDV